jgi:membrane protease YdiL (CAAX protease family)
MDTYPEPTSPQLDALSLNAAAPSVAEPAQPTAAFYRRQFFFGPFGLRAIWSLLIFIALIFVCATILRTVQHQIIVHQKHAAVAAGTAKAAPAKPDEHEPEHMLPMILGELSVFGAFVLVSWIMGRIEHRKSAVYGLGGARPVSRFLMGALWGLIAMALLIAMLHFGHLVVFDSRLDHGAAIFGWGFAQLIAFLLVGLFEEYCFRGYLQYTLTRGMVSIGNLFSPARARPIAFWVAAVLTSALFYKAHTGNSGETPAGLLAVFLAGLLLIVALWRTGSLWWAIGFHMAWDWSQSFLYGVPDSGGLMQGRLFATHALGKPLLSGGTDGPEGSLLCIPVMLLVIAVLIFFTKSSPQPPLEPVSRELPSDPMPSILPLETA